MLTIHGPAKPQERIPIALAADITPIVVFWYVRPIRWVGLNSITSAKILTPSFLKSNRRTSSDTIESVPIARSSWLL
jgi:hypothetical protein